MRIGVATNHPINLCLLSGEPPVPERDFDSAVPVRVRVEPLNSLNNRFKLDPAIHNRAVLSLDDDIMMPCADVERGFALWRTRPETMVGYFPRLIEGSPLVFNGEAYAVGRGAYNAVLTGAAFIDTETAFPLYWADAVAPSRAVGGCCRRCCCWSGWREPAAWLGSSPAAPAAPAAANPCVAPLAAVDTVFNGEDLLMNFVLANRSQGSAIEFLPPTVSAGAAVHRLRIEVAPVHSSMLPCRGGWTSPSGRAWG